MIERIALMCLNIPYLWGGKNPLTGFDCSGLSEWILATMGIDPPGFNNAHMLYLWFLQRGVAMGPRKGAFCFYGTSEKITHIAYMLNEHLVIEAGGGDSTTTNIEVAKKQGACVRIRPFGHRKDLVAVIFPKYPDWVEL